MLKLRVVQARYGDCLILENITNRRRCHILIDGGPSNVYPAYLRSELQRIAAGGGKLDLIVLSHIDNDHVVGLVDMMKDIKGCRQRGVPDVVQIAGMWHNAFDLVLPEAGEDAAGLEDEAAFCFKSDVNPPEDLSFGVGEGEKLQLANQLFGIPRNLGFPQGVILQETAQHPMVLGGMKLWVLGPSRENLEALRSSWLAWLAARREPVSFDVGGGGIQPDDSVNNLSSIMLLAETGRRRVLLTGDGRSEDIINGLERTGLLKPGQRLHVNILKLPHHGSARNCVGELFDRVTADTYVISADGHYGNPDPETLQWLVEAACQQDRVINIFATNTTDALEALKTLPAERQRHFKLTIMPRGVSSVIF